MVRALLQNVLFQGLVIVAVYLVGDWYGGPPLGITWFLITIPGVAVFYVLVHTGLSQRLGGRVQFYAPQIKTWHIAVILALGIVVLFIPLHGVIYTRVCVVGGWEAPENRYIAAWVGYDTEKNLALFEFGVNHKSLADGFAVGVHFVDHEAPVSPKYWFNEPRNYEVFPKVDQGINFMASEGSTSGGWFTFKTKDARITPERSFYVYVESPTPIELDACFLLDYFEDRKTSENWCGEKLAVVPTGRAPYRKTVPPQGE